MLKKKERYMTKLWKQLGEAQAAWSKKKKKNRKIRFYKQNYSKGASRSIDF